MKLILRIICAFIGHDWAWNRVVTARKTARWMNCDRCFLEVYFPDELTIYGMTEHDKRSANAKRIKQGLPEVSGEL